MIAKPIPKSINSEIFLSKVDKTSNCWNWIGTLNGKGYGQFSYEGVRFLAHRVSYELFSGDLVQGLVIDHICMNKSCVNPAHLRQVSPAINATENSNSMSAINKTRTHCSSGHELTDENVYLYKGHRECRTCKQRKSAARDYTDHNKTYKANMKSAGRSIDKMKELEMPTIECDIYDYIEVKGRISKKLFEKVVMPQLKELSKYKQAFELLKEANEFYADTDEDDGGSLAREAAKKVEEILNG